MDADLFPALSSLRSPEEAPPAAGGSSSPPDIREVRSAARMPGACNVQICLSSSDEDEDEAPAPLVAAAATAATEGPESAPPAAAARHTQEHFGTDSEDDEESMPLIIRHAKNTRSAAKATKDADREARKAAIGSLSVSSGWAGCASAVRSEPGAASDASAASRATGVIRLRVLGG